MAQNGRGATHLVLLVCTALLVVSRAEAAAPNSPQYSGFIRIANERFVDDSCKEFLPLGLNACVPLPAASWNV